MEYKPFTDVSTGDSKSRSVVSKLYSSSNNIESVKLQGKISIKMSLLGLGLHLKMGDGRGHSVEVVSEVGSE